jgi:hypothetical protein
MALINPLTDDPVLFKCLMDRADDKNGCAGTDRADGRCAEDNETQAIKTVGQPVRQDHSTLGVPVTLTAPPMILGSAGRASRTTRGRWTWSVGQTLMASWPLPCGRLRCLSAVCKAVNADYSFVHEGAVKEAIAKRERAAEVSAEPAPLPLVQLHEPDIVEQDKDGEARG